MASAVASETTMSVVTPYSIDESHASQLVKHMLNAGKHVPGALVEIVKITSDSLSTGYRASQPYLIAVLDQYDASKPHIKALAVRTADTARCVATSTSDGFKASKPYVKAFVITSSQFTAETAKSIASFMKRSAMSAKIAISAFFVKNTGQDKISEEDEHTEYTEYTDREGFVIIEKYDPSAEEDDEYPIVFGVMGGGLF